MLSEIHSPGMGSWWIGELNAMMVPKDVMTKDYTTGGGEFTDEAYVEAVQTFLDMNEKGYFGDHVNSKDYYQVREQFCAGQAAMMLDATAQFTQFDDGMGAENWGYFKVPVMEGAAGDPGTISGGAEAWIVSKNTKHPEEAIKFLKFMTSLEQGQKQTKEAGLPNTLVGGITAEMRRRQLKRHMQRRRKAIQILLIGWIARLKLLSQISIW